MSASSFFKLNQAYSWEERGRKGIHRQGNKQCRQTSQLTHDVYDQVLEAAVIAIPHPKWTERPLLVVVAAEGSKLTKEDMLNFLQVFHKIGHASVLAA